MGKISICVKWRGKGTDWANWYLLTAFRLSASETAEFDRCLNKSITLVIGDFVMSVRRTAVTV